MKTIETHISSIKSGDTIIHDGLLTTVTKTNIKFDPCMGKTLFGDSYHSGNKKVIKVISF